MSKKDACYHKVKSRYSVWPSAYASGALVKCRKVGAKNWGTKSEDMDFYNSVCNYLIEEGFAADVEGANSVILKLNDDILNDIYERKMTKGEKTKETKLKGKYDDSGMKASMIQQYGPVKGPQVYFATIRKQAMEEVEVEEGFKSIDKDKENRMYRRAGNLARQSLASKGKKKYEAAKKSANIVGAITRQKENERFAKMADEKARDNYGESFEMQEGHPMYDPERTKKATSLPAINPKQDPRQNKKNLSIGKSADAGEPNAASILRKRTGGASLPNIKKEELNIDPAVDYFFSEGINEDGLEMIIQEVGLEKFVEFVEHFSDQQILTEARAAKKARKGAKSYAEVKAEIDAKEKAKRAKREISVDKGTKAVETAKAKQPEKKPVRDAIARGVFGAVKAYQSGMERHRKAMELAKETGKTVAKAAAVTHEAGRRAGESKVGQAVKKAGSAAIKAGVEKAKKDIQSLKKEEVELSEAPFQVYDMRDKVNIGKEMKNKKRARTKADKLDQEYGAYRYKVIPTGDDRPEVKYGTKKEEVEFVSEKDEKVEAKYKGAKTPYLLSKFRKEHPGSRQEKKVPGAKETEGEAAARRRGAQAERAAKHGLTSKEKKETQAREKYYSARD